MKFVDKTTLGYIIHNDEVLMLHRNKKINDINAGKWVGVGGHIEKDETSTQCIIREIKEETGLIVKHLLHRGIISFSSDDYNEIMHLFLIDDFEGEIKKCDEGELKWIKIKDVFKLNMWEGDKIFLPKLFNSDDFIRLKLTYKSDILIKVSSFEDIIEE